MKKLIPAFVISITIICNCIYAQTTLQTIDFLNENSVLQDAVLQHKQKYQIKIININRNIYKVEDSFKETALNSTPPSVFSAIKLPAFFTLNNQQFGFNGGTPSNKNIYDYLLQGSIDSSFDENNLKALFSMYTNYIEKINDAVLLNNRLINLATDCHSSFQEINSKATGFIKVFLNSTSQVFSHEQYEEILRDSLNSYISTAKSLYKLINQINALADEEEDMPKDIKDYLDDAKEAMNGIKDFENENKIELLINNYDKLSEPYFTYYTKPFQPKKDEIEVNIDVTSDKLNCKRTVPVNYNNSYKVSGGWKIDFSTGVFFNGGNKDFLGRDLEYLPDGSDSVVTIYDKNENNRMMLSVGGFAHIYKRTGRSVTIALSPGISTTLNLDGVNLHLGGSIIFGRKNRGIITAGATFKESAVLNSNYSYDGSYTKKLLPDDPPSTKKFPVVGWFVALTYNISKLQKEASN